ncbi:MAG: nucleotidyltransferase family protein [Burkholderiales bacterium]
MKPSQALEQHRLQVRDVVARHHGLNPRVFGSVLHRLDEEQSDIDLLIEPTAQTSLLDLAKIEVELQRLLGFPVDVVTPASLPRAWRQAVLDEAQPV